MFAGFAPRRPAGFQMFILTIFLALVDVREDRLYDTEFRVIGHYSSWAECDAARWAWFNSRAVPDGLPPAGSDQYWYPHMVGECERALAIG